MMYFNRIASVAKCNTHLKQRITGLNNVLNPLKHNKKNPLFNLKSQGINNHVNQIKFSFNLEPQSILAQSKEELEKNLIQPSNSLFQFVKSNQRNSLFSSLPRTAFVSFNRYYSNTSDNQSNLLENQEEDAEKTKREKIIGIWLFVCCGLIFGMIVLGGITRLTESGLSIVDWKPIVGSIPPTSLEDWKLEFEKYKMSPEYQKLNFRMNLEEFKKIFWMEWSHRELGRFIGLAFAAPLLFFATKGWIKGSLLVKCTGLLALGGFQGVLGWFMVKSGLDHSNFKDQNSVPRVSQYRLAAHLMSALVLYSSVLWIAIDLVSKTQLKVKTVQSTKLIKIAKIVTGMIFTTVFSGAFVAGLDAGLIYNTFPLMGGKIIPEHLYSKQPFWKNWFENDTTVQFNHRLLGISTFVTITSYYLYALQKNNWANLPRNTKLAFHSLFGIASLQVILGITTLLTFVPIPLAASHQAGAVTLLTSSLVLLKLLKK